VVLDAKGTANANTGSVTNVARFDLGGASSAVTVSYDATVTLSNTDLTPATMTMTPEVVGAALAANQATATAVTSSSQVTLASGLYFLWVGGSISQLTTQATGIYSGTFNIDVELQLIKSMPAGIPVGFFKISMKKTLLLILTFIILTKTDLVFGQVSIAPTTIFIDQNGIGSVFITNPGNSPQEINVSFIFGYPGNDDLGNLIMVYSDSIRAKQFGIDDRVRAFPRTFILAPQQQQTVRLQVRPDRSLAAGTYFTRVKITSNAQTTAVDEVPQEEVATRVSFKFDQVIAAFQK